MNQPNVMIVDDRSHSREGLRALLATRPEINLVAEAANGFEAVQLVEKYRPNVVLMDVHMPIMDGLEATRLIKSQWPQTKVIMLTIHNANKEDALAAGADVFMVKGGATEELLEAILSKKE